MFKILDGREAFYQWDVDQKIVVDDRSIMQVHYCNRTDDCALICECYELDNLWVADVPNILLQDNWRMRVYAYDGCATKHEQRFNVIARSKPDTYVYTETEVLSYETINKRMDEIEGNLGGAIKDYLEENPVEVDLTGYATEQYVNEAVAAIEIPDDAIRLTSGAITDTAIKNAIVDIYDNGLTNPVFIDGYPVIGYQSTVDGGWKKLRLYIGTFGEESVGYYTSTFFAVPDHIEGIFFKTPYATKAYVTEQIGAIKPPTTDLSNYYTKEETEALIPSTAGLATESYVQDEINKIEFPSTDLSDYYTKTETETLVAEAIADIEIPESGGTGGTVESIEEVYVGTDTPTAESIKIWFNPDEEVTYATEDYVDEAIANIDIPEGSGGSVAVDGLTIIQNEDGTISTALGGSKELTTPSQIICSQTNETGWTKVADNNSRYGLSSFANYTANLDTTKTYNIELEAYRSDTNETCVCKGFTAYSGSIWKVYNITIFDDKISEVGYNTTQKLYLVGSYTGASYYNVYFITKFTIATEPVYQYNKIDSNYLNVGVGLQVQGGILSSEIYNITNNDKNILLQKSNTYNASATSVESTALLGFGNSLVDKAAASQGTVVFGRNNKVYGAGGAAQALLGDANSTTNLCFSTAIVGSSNSANYAKSSAILGNKNTMNGTSSGNGNHTLVGYNNQVNSVSQCAFGAGNRLIVGSANQVVYGTGNIEDTNSTYNVIIGNSFDINNRANGLTINASGDVAIQGTISSAGADYAEYFEWLDGNPEAEDRVGLIVVLDGDKIRLAQAGDEDILGIVSGTATVLGDDAEWAWQGKYLRDAFGRLIMEEVETFREETVYDEYGMECLGTQIISNGFSWMPKVNPDFDENKEYISRAKRTEWDAIGMMGKLYVKDDGTCVVNGYAVPGADGVATLATGKSNMRVMERISDNIVRVLLK